MTEPSASSEEDWYRTRWHTLMELLSVEAPDAVLPRVRELRAAVDDSDPALSASPFNSTEDALEAIESMGQQLDALYREKAATEQIEDPAAPDGRDTFEQLRSAAARDEKLRRELGVSSADALIEMVKGLADQLDELYTARGRLSDLNVSGTDDAIEMIRSMQQQLEALYDRQEQLSTCGAESLDHAHRMIENMEDQLVELYDERRRSHSESSSEPTGPLLPYDTLDRLSTMDEAALEALPVGAFGVDEEGRIRRANSAALDWPSTMASRPEALTGTTFASLLAGTGGHTAPWNRLTEGAPGDLDLCFLFSYVREQGASHSLAVQLYRDAASLGWVLFRPL